MNINRYITTNPKICHGKPVFKGTRIMVYLVLDLLAADVDVDKITKDYYPQLSKNAVKAALEYAANTIKDEYYVPFVFKSNQVKNAARVSA